MNNIYIGYQRLYQVSQKKIDAPKTLTEWKTRKIFDYVDLHIQGSVYKAQNIHGFVAKYACQAWHTDLHFQRNIWTNNCNIF